jgi:septal ring factor EnvC (AmiA/AmiB activator)
MISQRFRESKIRALFFRFSCCVTSKPSAHSCPSRPICYTPGIWLQRPGRKKRKATLDSVLSAVERGFAAVADDITDIKSKMATKDDIANLGGQLTSVERELKSIRRDLDDLREKIENVSGFQKEIDHALERVAAIESSASTRRSPPDRHHRRDAPHPFNASTIAPRALRLPHLAR